MTPISQHYMVTDCGARPIPQKVIEWADKKDKRWSINKTRSKKAIEVRQMVEAYMTIKIETEQ